MPDFTDAALTPRARRMALWLCDLTNAALSKRDREVSCDLLLRELPDHWEAGELVQFSRDIRFQVGPRASHIAWLNAAGWLVGEDERLPDYERIPLSEYGRMQIQQQVRRLLAGMQSAPVVVTQSRVP